MAYEQTKSLLREFGLAPHKKMGQNFLVHRHTAERIVSLAGISPGDTIVEVGVGLGALTNIIAASAARVTGIEADSGLVRWHREQDILAENVTLLHGDILTTDLAGLVEDSSGRLKIVANLPYSISSPFLFSLLDHRELVDWAVVMVQKEVALRLMAQPGTKEYGVPSVLFAGCAVIEQLLQVKPGEFYPRPKVDSMVIRLRFHPAPPGVKLLEGIPWPLLRKVVNASFSQRRKTLVNSLSSGGFLAGKKETATVIEHAGISPSVRAERLTFAQFARLTSCVQAAMNMS